MKALDLTGQRFGRLVVIERAGSRYGHSAWLCKCDCGNTIVATASNLKGRTTSCGCYQREAAARAKTKHGKAHTKIHYIWLAMKKRCFNENSSQFKDWGGRGITVCDEWKNDFQAFYDYVSKLPHFGEAGYSLDRINNDGNYEPNNVRWATRIEQNNNRRGVRNGTKNL